MTDRVKWRVGPFVLSATITGALLAAYAVGHQFGVVDERKGIVVRSGSPYYGGEYFGECERVGNVEYCATDKANT